MAWIYDHYDWFKALHVIAAMSWMAGLLYLPRLYVYHCRAERGSIQDETFKLMERRLLKAIMNPAMTVTWLLGLLMIVSDYHRLFADGWMHVKLFGIVMLTVFHMRAAKWRKAFEAGTNAKTERFFRMMNEVPTVLMVLIVIMAIVEPF